LFILLDLAFLAVDPASLGRVSLYNHFFPGRLRLPFGEDSAKSYNLSLFNLDAMFASHVLASAPRQADEYRVIIIGDSSVWGILLRPEQTLAGQLDSENIKACGKKVRVYNLGYPTISLTKDLMVMDYAMRYQPDLIIWAITLEAFPLDKQLASPIVANNATRMDRLISHYQLEFGPKLQSLNRPGLWDRTLIGQRRGLADLIRLQFFGVLWSATGIDQNYPSDFERAQIDFGTDIAFHGLQPPVLDQNQLAFSVLEAGLKAAGDTPVLILNEPIMISDGKNSDIRYNYFYPRWAYDQWREIMSDQAIRQGWNYLDLWDTVPLDEFTNSAIHLTPEGETLLASRINQSIPPKNCR